MSPEPFRPEALRTEVVTDSHGRPIGHILSSRYVEEGGEVASLLLELSDDVRRERLVKKGTMEVAAWAFRIENGKPRLVLSIDELLRDRGVSHTARETHPSIAPEASESPTRGRAPDPHPSPQRSQKD
jgi:hypothetical protein